VFDANIRELGGKVALKVFNLNRKPQGETNAMKEFRLMVELNHEKHILKPLKFIKKGSVQEIDKRTGSVRTFKERQIIASELSVEGDLFDFI